MDSKTTIMIIDDDDDDRSLFREAVEESKSNCEFMEADSSAEAFAMLERLHGKLPDIIFLDLNMPGITGKQFLKKIKENRKLKEIPVVIYSTSKRLEDYNETIQLGAMNFIIKPASFEDICNVINESLLAIRHFKPLHHR
jgi:CheY-like chemotaxis protein